MCVCVCIGTIFSNLDNYSSSVFFLKIRLQSHVDDNNGITRLERQSRLDESKKNLSIFSLFANDVALPNVRQT